MNPTNYSFNAILMAVLMLLASPCLFANEEGNAPSVAMTKDGRGGYILDELVVQRKADVKNVRLEPDGSFTLLSSSPTDVYSALNSGVGVAVNFQLSFARHSIVLTADGEQTMATIARALTLIGQRSAFKLLVHRNGNQDPKGRKKLTQSRSTAIVNKLINNFRINSTLLVGFESNSTLTVSQNGTPVGVDSLNITVVNLGCLNSG